MGEAGQVRVNRGEKNVAEMKKAEGAVGKARMGEKTYITDD